MSGTLLATLEAGLRDIVSEEVRKIAAVLRDEIRADIRSELDAERAAKPPERLDVLRAAERLSVSPATIRRRIKDGTLPTFRLGRRVLVEVSAVRSVGDIAETSRREVAGVRRGLVSVPRQSNDR